MRPKESPETAPNYVKAIPGPKHTVLYTDEKGDQWQYSGGSRPWRNQNPGNLVPGGVSKRNGAIGAAGGFAVFPDYSTGHQALLDSLRNVHGEKDIPALISVYAPPKQNRTKMYIAFVQKRTGVKGNKKIKDFTATEFEKLWHAIEDMEGWGKSGSITKIPTKAKITAVRRNEKGSIVAYQVSGIGWLPKDKAIAFAKAGKIDAVVAISRAGIPYLRTRPNATEADNLGNMP